MTTTGSINSTDRRPQRSTEPGINKPWVPVIVGIALAAVTWLVLALIGGEMADQARARGEVNNFWDTTWRYLAPIIALGVGIIATAIGLARNRRTSDRPPDMPATPRY